MKKFLLILLAVICCGAVSQAFASQKKCQYYVKVKNNTFGAVNLGAFRAMKTAVKKQDDSTLNVLIGENKVKKINTDKKLCVADTPTYQYAKIVLLPEDDTEYFVEDSATTLAN